MADKKTMYCPHCGGGWVIQNVLSKYCYCSTCGKHFDSPTAQGDDSPGPVERDDDRQTTVKREE